jgi:SAM-dependent methyltransferase
MVQGRNKIIGLDLDELPLRKAKAHPFHGLLQGSITTLPLSNDSVSGIVSIETLEHIPNVEVALSEFVRCLKGNGYLLLTVPSVTLRSWWDMYRFREPVYCCDSEHVREFSAVNIRGFPHKFETWTRLEERLHSHGFQIIRRSGVGFLFPMFRGKFAWMEHGMNLMYRERINEFIGRLPVFRKFPYYLMYLAQLKGKDSFQ